ncbi:hypothetical protein FRB99_006268 [Tulasnella sp. 403]|nr:hypothetical protein FRB99_006268 [Tulasnella sp. 403]
MRNGSAPNSANRRLSVNGGSTVSSTAPPIPEEDGLEAEQLNTLGRGDHTLMSWFDEDHHEASSQHLPELGSARRPVDPPVKRSNSLKDGWRENSRFDKEQETAYLRSKLWWLGFLLLNVGELGNFLSYAFAPASVFALIANCFFAPLMLKERFRKRDFLGIIIAILGAVTVVISSKSSDVRLDPDQLLRAIKRLPFVIYASVSAAAALVLMFLSEQAVAQRIVYVDVGLCGLFGGFTVLSTKGISTLLSIEWIEIFAEPIFYILAVVLLGTGVGQVKYLNRALMSFDSKIVVPAQFVLFNLSAIIGSAILYRDFDNISEFESKFGIVAGSLSAVDWCCHESPDRERAFAPTIWAR